MENLEENFNKIIIPELKFGVSSPKEDAEKLAYFCQGKSSGGEIWKEIVFKYHPKLKEMLQGINDQEEIYNKCLVYCDSFINENKEELEISKKEFQKNWDEVGVVCLDNLCKDFEIDELENKKQIKGNVSINPICPRDLDRWEFSIFYKFSNETMKEVSIHEIIHFLYFKKWAEIFPEHKRKTFDHPHSQWILSEILVISIMNENKKIQEILKGEKSKVYKHWQHIKIEGKNLDDYFGLMYKEHLESEGKVSFTDFLKKCWSEYSKHKEDIEVNIKAEF